MNTAYLNGEWEKKLLCETCIINAACQKMPWKAAHQINQFDKYLKGSSPFQWLFNSVRIVLQGGNALSFIVMIS